MRRENDRRSDSKALLDVPPSPDIAALEAAAESLIRFGDVRNATALWAIALRLRMEANRAVT
jgi:hypothetical protein